MSNETKHTQGPWTVDYAQGIIGPDDAPICYILDAKASDKPCANASLIAAAPDLLAACKALIFLAGAEGEFSKNAIRVYGDANAAIAKAEGRA